MKKMYNIIIKSEAKKDLLRQYLNNTNIYFNISGLDIELYYFSILADSEQVTNINGFIDILSRL